MCLNATALVAPAPQFVIPAKAGIHALTFRERTSTGDTTTCSAGACPPLGSDGDPTSSFRRKHPPNPDTAPESRGVWAVPIFIPWCAGPCRHERLVLRPIRVSMSRTRRSGMRSNGFRACRGTLSIRHSGEGRNPEGRGLEDVVRSNPEGRGWRNGARGLSPAGVGVGRGRIRRANSPYQATTPAFHTLVCRRQPA